MILTASITTTSLTAVQQTVLAALPAHDGLAVRVADLVAELRREAWREADGNGVSRVPTQMVGMGLAVRRRDVPGMPGRYPRWCQAFLKDI